MPEPQIVTNGSEEHSDARLGFTTCPGPDIAAAAARAGHYLWLSSRLYEVTGNWATSTGDPRQAVGFASAAGRFAWQAGEWRRRLPQLREVDPQTLIRPPSAASQPELDRLASTPDGQRVTALLAVVAELDGVYGSHADAAVPLRDGPTMRSLQRIRADLAELTAELSDI